MIYTHGDGDHTSGTGGFSKIYMHASDYIQCEIGKRYPGTSLVEIKDDDVIELGDRPLKIIHIPGHTKGSIAILDVNHRALYAGDSVQKGNIYMFGDKRAPSHYVHSLDKLIAIKDAYDWIYASHDEYRVANDYVEKVKAAWEQVQNGEAEFEMVDLFGNQVKLYTTSVCGFYME